MNRDRIASTADAIWGWLLWGSVVALAGLAAFGIRDYQAREAERAERIHQAGMAVGAALCPKESE